MTRKMKELKKQAAKTTRIIMPRCGQLRLAQDFGVTPRMVYKALVEGGRSQLAHNIRAAALEQGGELYERIPAETIIAQGRKHQHLVK